ncbi:MAG: TRZ/ATZ family hydrolase [Rhodocyclaceae bacterium]|nr:TRZ/ATZ family hydrolase [Rhodocyclaceae bacterium]
MKEAADLLLLPRWVITVEPDCRPLSRHAVAIRDGRIAAVLPVDQAQARFDAGEILDLPGQALIPGLVNAHTHAAMSLLRGIGDDLPLMEWLNTAIWPVEGKHVSAEFVRDGTLLAAAEMLQGGITTFNDMYFFPEAAAEAVDRSGIRAVLGIVVIEFPSAYANAPDGYLARGLAARDALKGHDRIRFALAPHAPYTVSDATFQRVQHLADELDLTIHVHLHETAHEIEGSIADHGVRPVARLARLGLLSPNLLAVHSVHMDASEIAELSRHGARVAHCPSSNMKLASGIAPVPAMLAAGIPVGLGTDGAASNNRLDLFEEMRQAALLAKVGAMDATAVSAAEALTMATLGGARALGLDNEIGSIVPGKWADLCAVALDTLDLSPCFDPLSHLVYVAGRENVRHVWVGGQLVARDRHLTRVASRELLAISALWQNRIAQDGA